MINSSEEAYKYIALEILSFIGDRQWESGGAKYEIWNQSIGTSWWLEFNGVRDETGSFPAREASALASEAVRFLRQEIIKTTGDRIWGVNFSLYPDGKFNVEYDYNKQNGLDESAETISGDEINMSLNRISSKGQG
ncbi:hypothetical protein [Herbaspirillum rubrisubalbicans]|uniref:hypothetical protein n=1 Tax=Herbaspirillum rubrisubalbicans TaxID=80842 RepID=UPI0011BDBCBD|nr:hypothetical protein [Herbaspirillum rubrisubalbicans]